MQFKVGEIAIIQNAINFPSNNGKEAEVVGGLEKRLCNAASVIYEALSYQVRTGDGETWYCLPHQLRKKNIPPKEDTTTWEEFKKVCGFDPSKVSA